MLLGRGSDSHDSACCYHKVIFQVLPVISQDSCQDTHSVGRVVILWAQRPGQDVGVSCLGCQLSDGKYIMARVTQIHGDRCAC